MWVNDRINTILFLAENGQKQSIFSLRVQDPLNISAARNGPMSILITWINSLLSIYFIYPWGGASTKFINTKISNFYDGFFTQKWHYNNNPYKSCRNNEFFDAIWNHADAAARIKLYDPILFWEYVYILYSSKIKGGCSTLVFFAKTKDMKIHLIFYCQVTWSQQFPVCKWCVVCFACLCVCLWCN